MFSNDERVIYAKRQLVEVICQLRFPEILKIDVSEPADFQERIRRDYPQYEKKIEQLPPQMVNVSLRLVEDGVVAAASPAALADTLDEMTDALAAAAGACERTGTR